MEHLERLMKRYPMLAGMREEIELVFCIMKDSYEKGGKLLVCGNGGSAADSDHIVGELMKGFYKQRKLPTAEKIRFGEQGEKLQGALPAIALSQHSALSTAFLNDVDPDMVFAQQVYGYGAEDDVFLGLSTSGNSVNVISAAKVAAAKGMKVIAMTGKDGGAMRELCDVCLIVPAQMTADIQEFHLPIYHALCAMLEDYFFPGE
ncbi:MAG: SIS domain-containing protein [Lachnospiraceae bacterium]|jgi:D-sedoheptulose 7-phosphate isomerase|nr:SIS domain-containing protein [Lachnospiraceae bacterium]